MDETLLGKIELVDGDITKENLGIDEAAERCLVREALHNVIMNSCRKLTESVNLVFHSAATVRFDEDLTKSVAMNVTAVLAMVNLARKMKKLEVNWKFKNCMCNTR